jgi:hypothetical protein
MENHMKKIISNKLNNIEAIVHKARPHEATAREDRTHEATVREDRTYESTATKAGTHEATAHEDRTHEATAREAGIFGTTVHEAGDIGKMLHGISGGLILKGAIIGLAAVTVLASMFAGCAGGGGGNTVVQGKESSPSEADGGSSVDTSAQASEEASVSGRWTLENSFMPLLTADRQAVFEKAISVLNDASYEPVFVIGDQVVAGRNSAYLCHRKTSGPEAEQSWVVVVVYEDLKGDAEVIAINGFNPEDVYTVDPKVEEYMLVGGWSCPSDEINPQALSDEAYDAFRKATTNSDSSMYFEPIVLLASMRAEDTYYRLLCRGTYYGTEPPMSNIYMVDVCVNGNGKASIYSYKRVDVSAYVKAG